MSGEGEKVTFFLFPLWRGGAELCQETQYVRMWLQVSTFEWEGEKKFASDNNKKVDTEMEIVYITARDVNT